MTVEELLPRLDAVRRASRGYIARCPAHADHRPSLSVSRGEKGILMKCWSGCNIQEITSALGIRVTDLFFKIRADPHALSAAQQQREWERRKQAKRDEAMGMTIDALRGSDSFIRSRQAIDISLWSNKKLDDELTALAAAYQLLECEAIDG